MTDFDGLPLPDGAPEPGACIRVEEPEEGLVRLHLDPPHRPKLAVLDVPLLRDLDRALDHVRGRSGMVRGLVVAGRDPLSFAAGADVDAIGDVEDPALATRLVRAGQEVFQKLHQLGRSGGGQLVTVAAAGGPVPGGAYELCLACDHVVLARHPRTRVGLPETKLGIVPAWGGTQRLPRRVGVPRALDVILAGKLLPAKPAFSRGMVDRLTWPEYLWRVAADVALGRERCRRVERSGPLLWLVDRNPIAGAVISAKAEKAVKERTKGHYPAPLAALPLVVRAPRVSLRSGLAAEAEAVRPLVVSRTTKSLVRLFQLSERAKKAAELPASGGAGTERAPGFARAAVVGGGVMGGGIASLFAQKGIDVRLRDIEQKALDAAWVDHERGIGRLVRRRRLERHEGDAALDRLELTTEATGFSRCEVAIEAVAERLDVKRAVLGELAGMLPDDAVLATNTSSLSVDELAEGLPAPERFCGMHFFNPVRAMPLVEVVRGERTSGVTVARVARLALDLGKTPVVVRDVAGFLVNRVLAPYLDEAIRLLAGGVGPEAIDDALEAFGMPMGPCRLLDEVGLDIASHAGASLEAAYGERMTASRFLAPLVDAGELGKKSGAGIFEWDEGAKGRAERGAVNPRLPRGEGELHVSSAEIVDRLTLAMANESARALDEGVVASAGELDLATVLGTGFAPFRGGVLRHVDARGPAAVVRRLRDLQQAPDVAADPGRVQRFEPALLLERLARDEKGFHDDAD